MVQFHEHIITELLESDSTAYGSLTILSSGLCLSKLLSSLLLLHSHSQGSLLFLSPPPSLKARLLHHLQTHSPSSLPTEITADLPAHHRRSLYASGGVFFITPRILIVDLLTNKVPCSDVSGIIIPNVHSLTETSTEAFIVRIVKGLNRNVCVKAFSDKPQSMVAGFAKAERIMKCLFIRKLHLWPRFQVVGW